MPIGTAIMETVKRFLKEAKIDQSHGPTFPLLGIDAEIGSQHVRDAWTPMFIVTQFTMVKIQNQSRCSSANDRENVAYIHNELLLNHEKESNSHIWSKIDATGDHYTKWNKSNTETQVPHFFFCHVEVAVFKNKSVWMPCFFDNKLMFLLNNIPYIIMYYLFSFVLIFVTKVMGVAGPCGPPGRVKQFRVGDGGKGVR